MLNGLPVVFVDDGDTAETHYCGDYSRTWCRSWDDEDYI